MAYVNTASAHGETLVREELLQSRYADWKQRFDSTTEPELEKQTLHSPSWENLWHAAWAEYDKLESIRITRGFTKQTWQDSMDEYRRSSESMKKYRSESAHLTAYDWSVCPLGMILEKYLGRSILSGGSDAAVALERWCRFREVMVEQPEFQRSLSKSQRVSWTILTHWWSGTYQDRSLSDAAIASLEAAASSPAPLVTFNTELYPDAETFIQIRKSVYNALMFELFYREYNPYHWVPYYKGICLTTLHMKRWKAIRHATAQRLGYTAYMNLKRLGTCDAGSYLGSMDEPCPWLHREGIRTEMPYFLWDVEQRRTVTVNEMEARPEYYCVSHTWGRWRKESIPIDGVPWLVPQNGRFEVARLPEHLQRIRPQLRFVWIDLFCIPQDGSKKANDEINRQASIFQNASRCIAWINDVIEWSGTMKALDWLGISYLHITTCPGIYDTETLLQSLHQEAESTSELFSSKLDLTETRKKLSTNLLAASGPRSALSAKVETLVEPSTWFSSLWTLQEAMLCPEITFVTRDWVPLNDRAETPIPLDAFFGLIDIVDENWHNGMPYKTFTKGPMHAYTKYNPSLNFETHEYVEWPDGPRQLAELCLLTRMDGLLESPSPIGMLLVANVRQCTGSRAPAIMSALGVTDWYESRTKTDEELVMKCFPLAFVREAALKLGASFYESVTRQQKIPKRYDIFNRSHKGSMMPFSATNGWYSHVLAMPIMHRHTPVDHPAVKTWTIRHDGSVDIDKAGIVASTESSDANDLPFTFDIMKPGSVSSYHTRFGDLAEDIPAGLCMYAVSLLRDSERQYGLILQGYHKLWLSSHRLVKVGTFVTTECALPPTTDVDWVVW